MKEVVTTLKKYLSDEANTIHFLGDKRIVLDFMNRFYQNEVVELERPDAYIKDGNEILIVEHFEFDCSGKSRKGSRFRIEEQSIKQAEERIVPTEEGTPFHFKYGYSSSYDTYITNVISNFNKHAEKIEDYKKNLVDLNIANKETRFFVAFLIEDVSPIGASVVGDDNKPILVELAYSKEFIQAFKLVKEVDYVLAVSNGGGQKCIWVISKESIVEYEKNTINYNDMRFIDWNPSVVGGKYLLPIEFSLQSFI